VLNALGPYPLELLRVGPLLVSWFMLRFRALTPKERRTAEDPVGAEPGAAVLPAKVAR
jgi:hypothetical protein